jgi:hypothetical protein
MVAMATLMLFLFVHISTAQGFLTFLEMMIILPCLNAPINVMPDPREGGDTRGIDLISLLLGRGFYFI